MNTLKISTSKKKEVVDITNKISSQINIREGMINLFITHTTAALTTADLDPGTDLDFLDAIEAIAPGLDYRHPHDPNHTNDHIMSSIIGSSLSVPVKNNKLVLGTWQRVVLVELDGPRERNVNLSQFKLN